MFCSAICDSVTWPRVKSTMLIVFACQKANVMLCSKFLAERERSKETKTDSGLTCFVLFKHFIGENMANGCGVSGLRCWVGR